MRKFRLTLDMSVRIAVVAAVILAVLIGIWFFQGPTISVSRKNAQPTSPLTGLACADPTRRPIAVMLSSDAVARPLSGLGEADMVFEMPVTPDGITRMMAVYQCGTDPAEVGSIRSARQDFIPLAQGVGAILAHWGGEHDALAQLNAHVINNVDALIYEGTVFYRKSGVPAPHDGFTTLGRIRDQATKLGYAPTTSLTGYPHEETPPSVNLGTVVDHVAVHWPQGMDVEYRYDAATNTYARWRGGSQEIDKTTRQGVKAGVVIVLTTDSSFLRDQYIRVRTLGQGAATVYQDGQKISAHWSKPGPGDMLTFTDDTGHALPLALGSIWVEVDAPLPAVPAQ